MVTRSKLNNSLMAAAIAVTSMGSTQLMAEGGLKEALAGGEVKLDFRYRFENAEQDLDTKKEAWASTLKSRFTYTTAKWGNFQAQIEVDDVSEIGNDNYNSKKNGKTEYSVIADPEGTGINQAWIAYTGIENTTIKHGRTRVLLDNQRFVGGVGWRQNEQTYDVTAVVNTSIKDTTVFIARVRDIQSILGDAVSTNSNLVNVKYNGLDNGSWTMYYYDLDNISMTKGFRIKGSPEVGGLKVHYEFELATQQGEGAGPSYDADYSHFVLGATAGKITAKIGRETQESDGGRIAFRTPLGTNHGFNGWADKFLATPADGLEDTYLSIGTKLGDFKVTAVIHDFEAEDSSKDYGQELDLSISTKLAENVTVLGKYADFDGESGMDDTRKFWLQVQVKY